MLWDTCEDTKRIINCDNQTTTTQAKTQNVSQHGSED
jgi:hypothetical protein